MSTQTPLRPFWMMRHGQTVANVEGKAAGSVDTPLTERGREQAAYAARAAATIFPKPSLIVHSPLSRTTETAKIVNSTLTLDLVAHEALREICFGDWAGQPFDLVYPQLCAGATPPNGESMVVFGARVMAGLHEVLETYERPLIVAHGGVFDAFAIHNQMAIQDVENCALYAFTPEVAGTQNRWNMSKIII